jgi:hypothetical protein
MFGGSDYAVVAQQIRRTQSRAKEKRLAVLFSEIKKTYQRI